MSLVAKFSGVKCRNKNLIIRINPFLDIRVQMGQLVTEVIGHLLKMYFVEFYFLVENFFDIFGYMH